MTPPRYGLEVAAGPARGRQARRADGDGREVVEGDDLLGHGVDALAGHLREEVEAAVEVQDHRLGLAGGPPRLRAPDGQLVLGVARPQAEGEVGRVGDVTGALGVAVVHAYPRLESGVLAVKLVQDPDRTGERDGQLEAGRVHEAV